MMDGIREPDIVFYLRTKSGNSDEISKRSDFGNERYETLDIQRQVSINFDHLLLDKSNCHEINSCSNIQNVSDNIWKTVKMLDLNKK